MGMTMTEKIFNLHSSEGEVKAGDFVFTEVDLMLGNDITAPVAIKEFQSIGVDKPYDPDKIVLVPDHFTPNKDIPSAEQCKVLRNFAREMKINHYFEVGRMGIEHCLLPEQGLVLPGQIIIGADSHTCTYGALGAFATGVGSTDLAAAMATGKAWFKVPETIKINYSGQPQEWVGGKDYILYTIGEIGVDGGLYQALEFSGEAIESLSMAGRFTMSNMAIEAGAKAGLIEVDEKTTAYLEERTDSKYTSCKSDPDAEYSRVIDFDISNLEPQVALPHLPENTAGVSDVSTAIDQVVIGSCTNGRLEDLRIAARILKDKEVASNLRLIVIPGTQEIYLQAVNEGLVDIFVRAGAALSTPTCGPCLGGYMGILASGEKALATTNRNFVGRMGDPKSEVFLSSPAVAAASAITGYISHPQEVL